MRRALTGAQFWPAVRAGSAAVALFGLALALTRHYETPIRDSVAAHALLGQLVFFATSVLAVLMPMLSNLALVPVAVLAWGPGWTAWLLLSGWIVGAALSFTLGRHARAAILRHFPAVQRHARIDRLIDPRHRLGSLVLLRMTFPVDVLSYALGLFSARTTLVENTLSTAIGAAPFALLFAFFPTLSGTAQWTVFGASVLVFVLYARWLLHRPGA